MTATTSQHKRRGGYYRRDGKYVVPRAYRAASSGTRPVKGSGLALLPSARRKNGIGITAELPQWRSIGWNVVLVGVEAALICWAHYAVGVTWTTLSVGFAAVATTGIALLAWVIPRNTPRLPAEDSKDHENEVVDCQSTPNLTAPSLTSGVSRTR